MRLDDLDPQFVKREIRACAVGTPGCSTLSPHTQHEFHVFVDEIEAADGIFFLCPKCFETNKGRIGTHSVLCWRPRVAAGIAPGPGRWEFLGNGTHDLTLSASSSSIALRGECAAHFFVEGGAIRMA